MKHFIVSNFREGHRVGKTASYWIDIRKESYGNLTTFQVFKNDKNRTYLDDLSRITLTDAGYTNTEVKSIEGEITGLVARYETDRPRVMDPEVLLGLMKGYKRVISNKNTVGTFVVLDHNVWCIDTKNRLVEYRGVDEIDLSIPVVAPFIKLGSAKRYSTSLEVALNDLGLKKRNRTPLTGPHGKLAFEIVPTISEANVDPSVLLNLL
ncbi:MAG: hypothetical protein JRN21_09700 [Nitrososphaerota archaeon]|nr:hypothetical protein [Nitrososphaerota archaeon]